ncbi:MAG: alpha/beta fold hydrolase [Candidatus Heimdallarchaeota archaeon]
MSRSSNETGQPFANKIAITEDITISFYHCVGEKDLILLLFHGLGSSKEDYLQIFNYDKLKANTITIPDLVGHGESSKPPNFSYSMDDQAKILFRLLERLSFKSNIVLVAHSMGGPIAVSLAELLSDRVVGMVYAEGNIDVGDCFFSKFVIDSFSLENWEDTGFEQSLAEIRKDPDLADFAVSFAKAGAITTYKSSEDLVRVSKEDTLLERLIQLSIPVLAIFGAKNKGKFSSEKKLQAKFPIRYIPDAGHGMMVENPHAFYKTIIDFLEQC